ncbi:MAG TPA: NADH:ubiquinone reductase (Na(+)-transporting) subunit F [Porphyromonadaceae bacterium]|uniref:Na(+)-translocating NADH-quinone reductase subunit F n=1 Tax=Candidatus Caccoplasma intestinavium TaxID=2840716 RepID=A0A9D1GE23_9BACT|nr:NADH:ubiquinone reductase (Na(+)-transporting) subunit F [Porphyromonadaceae bacterium]HIT39395.1 NADH:ubiquinone reductase (Na(+)-transporting) subunit F [Candidatus Caccoplasma intestinavium]
MTAIILSLSNLTVVAAVVIFLALTLLLVVILLVAKARLMPAGNRRITINGERTVETPAGATLLASLASNKIFLPSACGGGGSCGMCRCRVLSGGGEILPTETGFFTRKQQQEHYRLACQVKVKNDLQIQVPQTILGIKKMECEVVSNRNVASFIKEFVVRVPEGEKFDFLPGSYVQIDVPRYDIKFTDMEVDDKFRDEWDKYKMWGLTCRNDEETFRAYSMANYPAEGNIIMLNIRIATPPFDRSTGTWAAGIKPGICSSYIFTRKPGDKVTLSGPYGDFHIQDTGREMIYIGGGAGMAPLRSHLMHLFRTLHTTDRKISYWYGARSRREIFYEEDFRAIERDFPNFKFNIALSDPQPEDNWTGYTGFIHQVLYDHYLKDHEAPEDIEYYMCGPGPMSSAVKKMLWDLGVPSEMLMYDDFGA